VHYNSDEPAKIKRGAFTKGKDIYLARGKENLLPHEIIHIIQQMQGRVKPTKFGEIEINDDEDLEREANEMGNLLQELSKDPTRMPDTQRNLLGAVQHHENTSRLEQLKTPSKDVIQMYTKEGEFANPDSSVAEDLEAVINNSARSTKETIDTYDNDPYTTLIFTTGRLEDRECATTEIEAKIGEDWHNIATICHPTELRDDLVRELRHNTPIRIIVTVDLNKHGTLNYQNGRVLATLVHEITVHTIHFKDWLRKLRSGAYTGKKIRDAWLASNGPGGLLNDDREHRKFAQGDNRAFNQTAENVYENIPRRQRRSYQKELRQDIDQCAVAAGKQPYYPV
jgi:hypothetical protein